MIYHLDISAYRPLATPIGRQAPGSDGPNGSRQRTGRDDLRAAMIYRHEAQGADKAITDVIDTHVLGEQTKRGDDGARWRPGVPLPRAPLGLSPLLSLSPLPV
jgi:hypothetical protein